MNARKLLNAFKLDVLFLFMVGGIFLYLTAGDAVVSLKPAVSFEDMLDGAAVTKGSRVEGNVIFAMDYFASESTYVKRQDGTRSTSKKSGNYYLIPTYDGYIGLKSRLADVPVLDKISDETYDYLYGGSEPSSTLFTQGSVHAMDDSLAKYYREYLQDMGYTDAEIEAFGTPLVIQYVNFKAVRIMSLAGILLVAAAVILLLFRYRRQS